MLSKSHTHQSEAICFYSPCKYPYTKGCEYLTYFNASGDLFREFCYTFSSCEETHACTNCVSETESCYKTCGKNFYGVIDNNFVDLVGDVDSESDCKDFCTSTETCMYYTYFTEDHWRKSNRDSLDNRPLEEEKSIWGGKTLTKGNCTLFNKLTIVKLSMTMRVFIMHVFM